MLSLKPSCGAAAEVAYTLLLNLGSGVQGRGLRV